jgi:hypothetical protein
MSKITDKQYIEAAEAKAKAEELMSQYHQQKREQFAERMRTNPIFSLDELRFSAYARCKGCGAGLAYPKECSPGHYWDCSAVLLGQVVDPGPEHVQYPFAFYEIKSEDQPSANGATTRPKN